MIPLDFVTEWRNVAPWPSNEQVEQDLIISRAAVEIFSVEEIAKRLAWRGGTALHKLYLHPAPRYSEDMDLDVLAGSVSTLRNNGYRILADLAFRRSLQPFGIADIIIIACFCLVIIRSISNKYHFL